MAYQVVELFNLFIPIHTLWKRGESYQMDIQTQVGNKLTMSWIRKKKRQTDK